MTRRPLPTLPNAPDLETQAAAQPPAGTRTGDAVTDAALANRRADIEGAVAIGRWVRGGHQTASGNGAGTAVTSGSKKSPGTRSIPAARARRRRTD